VKSGHEALRDFGADAEEAFERALQGVRAATPSVSERWLYFYESRLSEVETIKEHLSKSVQRHRKFLISLPLCSTFPRQSVRLLMSKFDRICNSHEAAAKPPAVFPPPP
jgi:alpha-L-fucosidase